MAKLNLTTLLGGFANVSNLNDNFAAIATEFQDKVLYRDNPVSEPNQMLNDLDMNSNDILNIQSLDTQVIKINGEEVQVSENAVKNTFIEVERTGFEGTNTYGGLAYTPGFIIVLINGVELGSDDYTATDGSTVVFTENLIRDGDLLKFRSFTSFTATDALLSPNNLGDVSDAAISRSNLGVYSTTESDERDGGAQMGTATFSDPSYNFTPISGQPRPFANADGSVLEFDLPVGSSNSTANPVINTGTGTAYTIKWIDGSDLEIGDLDQTYTKRIRVRLQNSPTRAFIISDVHGSNGSEFWERRASGWQVCKGNESYDYSTLTDETVNVPKAFADDEFAVSGVFGTTSSSTARAAYAGTIFLERDTTSFRIANTVTDASSRTIDWTAQGRWF